MSNKQQGSTKKPDDKPASASAKIWACVSCTFNNPETSQVCQMCGSPKPGTGIATLQKRSMASMFIPGNGRSKFDSVAPQFNVNLPQIRVTPAILAAMQERERELRMINPEADVRAQVYVEFGFDA